MRHDLKLAATVRCAEKELLLSFTAVNQSADDLLIFNALYKPGSGTPVINPNMVYTLLEGDVLTITKAVLPIPPGIQVEIPDVPYGVKLAPGEVLQGDVTLSLPVRYYNPHDLVLVNDTIICKNVRLRLGYARFADVDSPEPVQIDGRQYFRVKYRSALACQKVVESGAVAASVAVDKRP
jgi:hypothetical protein